ncbi:hypothetical protein KP509_32G005600, partial [Ceratopteris richardii]
MSHTSTLRSKEGLLVFMAFVKGSSSMNEASHCFNKFVQRVSHLSEMHQSSSKFIAGYQQELEKLRRPPLDDSSSVVKDLFKGVPSPRVKNYIELGGHHLQSKRQSLVKSQIYSKELGKLVDKVTMLMDADLEKNTSKDLSNFSLKQLDGDVEQ